VDRVAHRVEQDVGGLEVAVDDRRVGVVEEGEALGGAGGDLHPPHPRHGAVETCTQHVDQLRVSSLLINFIIKNGWGAHF